MSRPDGSGRSSRAYWRPSLSNGGSPACSRHPSPTTRTRVVGRSRGRSSRGLLLVLGGSFVGEPNTEDRVDALPAFFAPGGHGCGLLLGPLPHLVGRWPHKKHSP